MKRISFCLGLMALAWTLASCQQNNGNIPPPENSPRVCIGAGIHHGLKTRATGLFVPEGHSLRYIIEVWTTDDDRLIYRSELLEVAGEDVTFDFELEEMGYYAAVLWADFIPADTEGENAVTPNDHMHYADLYYQTDSEQGLREITLIPDAYRANHESRDAFYATLSINKEEGIFESGATLMRPFGTLNINEKEAGSVEKVSEIHCTYQVPQSFHTVEGKPGTEFLIIETTCTPAKNEFANLFYDYIFASQMGDMLTHDLTMSFTVAKDAGKFKPYIIPGNCIPLARNKRTIANGTILSTSKPDTPVDTKANISVTITSVWEETMPEDLPQQNGGDLPNINNQGNPFESIL